MSDSATDWIAEKLATEERLEIVGRTREDFLIVNSCDKYTFRVAVLGVRGLIELSDVDTLFTGANTPQFVVNVPSKTMWSGKAIRHIHAFDAAFGTLGDLTRAAYIKDAGSYRNKNMSFFITAMGQHSNVSDVSYVYETVFKAERKTGGSLIVAVIDAYNMSAEDVRNAKAQFGHFDIVVKSSTHGSITHQAEAAAESIGAEALTFGDLMRRLGR